MTKTLLATTAAVALIAGMSLAAAQGMKEGAPGAAGGTQGQPQAQPQKQGGTEKGSRTGQSGAGAQSEHNKMGQGAGEKNERSGQKSEEKGERTGQKSEEKNERTGQGAQRPGGTSTAERPAAGKSVTLSSDQKSRVKEVIGHNSSARVDHVDFSLSVGTHVPRTVHVVVLPEDIVRIVPEYRGYMYIVVRNEIVILDPDTLEIVAILPA
jgi:hypothetical protein